MGWTRTIQRLLEELGGRYPPPRASSGYLRYDDGWIASAAHELVENENVWAKSLYGRAHWKCVAEHKRGTLDKPEPAMDAVEWTDAIRLLQDRFGEEDTALDITGAKNFQRTDPGPYISGRSEAEERPKILVARSSGQADLVEKVSGIVAALSQENIKIRRLYARPEIEQEIRLELSRVLPGAG